MTEIWNLSTLCRCCHADGHFKNLSLSYQAENDVEIYENMLRDTLGVIISTPPLQASYTICDDCICKLRDAANFKNQVLQCEEKFQFYCNNEQFSVQHEIKSEGESEGESDLVHDDIGDINEINENQTPDIKKEDTIELTTKHHIEEVKQENETKIEIEIKEDITEKCSQIPEKTLKRNGNSKKQKLTKNKKESKKQENQEQSLIIKVDTDKGLYKTQKEINQHNFKTHISVYKCEYCEKHLKTFKTYKKHLKLHTTKNYQCTFCPRIFASKLTLDRHLKNHTTTIKSEKPYKCDICKKDFKSKQVLIRHLKVHAGTNKKILCHLCGKTFNDTSNLNAHTRSVHEKLRPFKCEICKKTFSSQRHLRDHLKLHSGDPDQKVYTCEICDYKLICPKRMKIHRLRHDGKFLCNHCPEIFDNAASKTLHIRLFHKKEVPCTICGKVLGDKFSLKRHIDIHKGIKQFSCDLCGLNFSQKAVLNRHISRKHNSKVDVNLGKTKCEICKRSFNNINAHMERHFNRSYACDICGKTYPNNSTLNRHKAWKHFGRSFNCEICEKKYYQKGKLNTHKLKVHQIKIEIEIEKGCVEGS